MWQAWQATHIILSGRMPLISKHVLYIEGLYDLFNYAACLSLYWYSYVSLSLSRVLDQHPCMIMDIYSPSMLLCHDYTRPRTTCFPKLHVLKIGHEHAASFSAAFMAFSKILQARAREAATAAITKLNLKRLKALMVGTLASAMLMFLEWCVFALKYSLIFLYETKKAHTDAIRRINDHIDTSINPPSNCPLAVPNCTVNCSIGLFRKLTSGCITHTHTPPCLPKSAGIICLQVL